MSQAKVTNPKETLVDLNREVEMMSDPDRWPAWPFLPLKRRVEGQGWPDTAYLYDAGVMDRGQTTAEPQLICREGNIHAASSDDREIAFESFTELLNAGWRVD